MTEARYHELLAQLLDGALSEAESLELRQALEADPDRLRDVREHLVLGELLAQEHAPHRGPEVFWLAVRNRLHTAADTPAAFDDSPTPEAVKTPAPRKSWRMAIGIAAVILVALGLAVRWAVPKRGAGTGLPAGPTAHGSGASSGTLVSLRGEAVCTRCLLHQTDECCPAVRVRQGGHEATFVLCDNAVSRDLKRKSGYCRAPTPVLAEGTLRSENGRQLLAATRLEVLP